MRLRVLAGALSVLALPALALGDMHYQRTTAITGGSQMQAMSNVPGMGRTLEPTTSTISIRGNKMAQAGPRMTQIYDLDAGTITQISHERKTYSVLTFEQMRQALESLQQRMAAMRGQQGEPQYEYDVKVEATAITKIVNGFEARQFNVKMTTRLVGQPAATPQATAMQMQFSEELWMTPTVPGLNEDIEFHRRLASKLGAAADMSVLAGSTRPGMAQGMAKLGEERRKLKGTPVETITRVYGQGGAPGMPPGAAGDAARNDARQGALARMGGLGRLGGMLGRKDSDSPSPASAPPSGAAPVANAAPTLFMETTSDMKSYSTAAVDPSAFEVPAGYKQVENEMLKMTK